MQICICRVNVEYVKLKAICMPKQWKTIASSMLKDSGYPVYGANGIIGYYSEYNHDKETILVTCRGATCGSVNICEPFSYINGNAMALDDLDGKIDIKYLYYYLKKRGFDDVISGSAQPQITRTSIEKIEIPICEISKQKMIVNLFDKIELLINNQKRQLQLLDELVKARFVEMFGDPIQNSKGYPIRQFSDYIISLTSGSRGWAKYCVNDGKEWFITIKNVKDCNIITDNIQPINAPSNAEAKRTKVEEGDLLISITADLGRTGVVTKEVAEHGAYINQHLSCIRIDREILNPLYVAYYMESSAGKRQFIQKNQSAVKAGLNFNSINSLKLLVPPMGEQNKFIRFVKQIDKSRLLSNHSLFLIKSIIF